MRILITGGAGFIGSHHAEFFTQRGHEVHVADRMSNAEKSRNIANVESMVKVWAGDLTGQAFTDDLLARGFDVVIHCAGATDVHLSIKRPMGFTIDNVVATARLLHAIQRSGKMPEKIILYSTDEVYGSTPDGQEFGEEAPFNASNSYAASKVGVEGLATAYRSMHNMPIIIVRPCYTYGPRMHLTKIIPHFVKLALEGKPMTVYERGLGKRDFLHHLDHSKGIETVIHYGVEGQAYNMPGGNERSGDEIAKLVSDILGVPPLIEYVDVKTGQDKRYCMRGDKIAALGWSPAESFVERLKETVIWFSEHQRRS